MIGLYGGLLTCYGQLLSCRGQLLRCMVDCTSYSKSENQSFFSSVDRFVNYLIPTSVIHKTSTRENSVIVQWVANLLFLMYTLSLCLGVDFCPNRMFDHTV